MFFTLFEISENMLCEKIVFIASILATKILTNVQNIYNSIILFDKMYAKTIKIPIN